MESSCVLSLHASSWSILHLWSVNKVHRLVHSTVWKKLRKEAAIDWFLVAAKPFIEEEKTSVIWTVSKEECVYVSVKSLGERALMECLVDYSQWSFIDFHVVGLRTRIRLFVSFWILAATGLWLLSLLFLLLNGISTWLGRVTVAAVLEPGCH